MRIAWIVLLLVAIALSFTLPYPQGVIQAALSGFLLGSKVTNPRSTSTIRSIESSSQSGENRP